MSEATTAAVAPAESPATTGTDQQTSAPAPAAAPQYQSPKQAAKEAALSRFRGADSAATSEPAPAAPVEAAPAPSVPVVDASGRPHDPATGRFLPNGEQDPSAVPADPPADHRPATVRIELPDGHFLRERGREYIDAPADQEQEYRALVNSGARRQEVEHYRQELARVQDELLRTQAQAEARQKFAGDVLADPGRMEVYQAIASVDPAAAEAMKRGWEAEADAEAQKLYGEKAGERAQQEMVQAATVFVAQAEHAAAEYLPPELRSAPQMRAHFDRARFQYGNHLEYLEQIGQPKQPDTQEFLDVFFRREILTDPAVQQWAERHMTAKQQQEAERVAAKAKADAEAAAAAAEQQRLQDAAQRHSTRHPFGQVPGNVRTDRTTVSTEQDPTAGLTGRALRNALRQQVISKAGGR